MGNHQVRIGIDVGGTFTDAVAIDHETYEVLSKVKIPTTHHDERGVASGIVQIIQQLMHENQIVPEDIKFIAHGTTQATNALLEGDVASVGIIGMGTGMDARSARAETKISNIELATGKYLHTYHRFIDSKELTADRINQMIDELINEGAEVIVASEAYSVDDPTNELCVIEAARSKGVYATGGHEISQLYGLKTRTRTAVVNASLIPKMMETANMTEQAVLEAGITSQLMIMRCDGGVMSIDEVRQRPILTMLSGLAAGVAGALMYEKISDGIFFEVGGTSVDISVIKNGKVMIENAQVGGHKTYLRSLDVRTLAVAGGSMIQVRDGQIVDVGPRSAHIAGLEYECFASLDQLMHPKISTISPRTGDPDYIMIQCDHNQQYALTLAGAANIMGWVPEEDYAYGQQASTIVAWQALADHLGISVKQAATTVIEIGIRKVMEVVDQMIVDYELDRSLVTLVGGGGSGAILVPAMANQQQMKYRIARNAPYISTIGVGMAMVREQIEKTVVGATEQDIKHIRAEIMDKIVRSGANEATVDITIEIDSQRNILRAIATGSTELRSKDMNSKEVPIHELRQTAAEALNQPEEHTELKVSIGRWFLFEANEWKKSWFGLFKKKLNHISVLDREGVVRFKKTNAHHIAFTKQDMTEQFAAFLDENTIYSDANATIPKTFIFYKEKMLDLTGMQTREQLFSILEVETQLLEEQSELLAVMYQ